ncbi:MAG TPA: carboxypeptidase-like regulatory domain-containing protein [Blastocatellia bacterium]|nr:carboxypeptidase-like regulatory domain-containing protein [Blastocatellia bacterium]
MSTSRRLFHTALLALLAALPSAGARAQNTERDRDTYNPATTSADITGQVRFGGTLGLAQGVRVILERVGGGTVDQMTTDNRGRFRFAQLPRGQYVVNTTAPCFVPDRRQVELLVIFRSYLDIELAPATTPRPTPGACSQRWSRPSHTASAHSTPSPRTLRKTRTCGTRAILLPLS